MGELRSKKKLFLRTMGISNLCINPEDKKLYSVQFYDYDKKGKEKIFPEDLKKIMKIFPYDCLFYETKHGFHFISFAILRGSAITKARAIQLTKELDQQDYWCSLKDLTLRVAPKWKNKTFKKHYQKVSKKPKFKGLIKEPNKYIISNKHLEFYYKFMNLPEWVYNKYLDCDKRDYKIKIVNYKTRD
ncbi:MAG: hypothetical protein ACFFDH_09480 [Promethearchaeota archaeon]